jgi:hypothetical protein
MRDPRLKPGDEPVPGVTNTLSELLSAVTDAGFDVVDAYNMPLSQDLLAVCEVDIALDAPAVIRLRDHFDGVSDRTVALIEVQDQVFRVVGDVSRVGDLRLVLEAHVRS